VLLHTQKITGIRQYVNAQGNGGVEN